MFLDELGGTCSHLAEELPVFGLLDIENRPQMKFAGGYMAVIDAGQAEFVHHSAEVMHIRSKTFGSDSCVFDDADGLGVAVRGGEDSEAGLAEIPDFVR